MIAKNNFEVVLSRRLHMRAQMAKLACPTALSLGAYKAALVAFLRLRRDMLNADDGKRRWYVRAYGFSIAELEEHAKASLRKMKDVKGVEFNSEMYDHKHAEITSAKKARDYRDLGKRQKKKSPSRMGFPSNPHADHA